MLTRRVGPLTSLLLSVVVAALISVIGAASATAAGHTVTVLGGQVVRVGSFKTSGVNGGRLGAAIRAFGQPSSRVSRYGGNFV